MLEKNKKFKCNLDSGKTYFDQGKYLQKYSAFLFLFIFYNHVPIKCNLCNCSVYVWNLLSVVAKIYRQYMDTAQPIKQFTPTELREKSISVCFVLVFTFYIVASDITNNSKNSLPLCSLKLQICNMFFYCRRDHVHNYISIGHFNEL